MNQATLKRTDRTSAEYVVLHAHLRKKRGLRPSLSFGGERNPQKALEIARAICRQKCEQSLERAILGVEKENDRTNWKKRHKRAMGKENAYCEDCGKPVSQWRPDEECVKEKNGKNEEKPCKHGNVGYCGFCATENEPRCQHGNVGYCGFCATENEPRCQHGNVGYCGLCKAEKEPRCVHGNVYYCGLCEEEKEPQHSPQKTADLN